MGQAPDNLPILVEVARRMGETFELGPLLETIEHAVRGALDAERATVFLYDPVKHELYSSIATGTGELRFSAERGIVGEAVRTSKVITVPDAYADPRFNRDIDRQTGYKTRNLLTIPLRVPDGDVLGALQVLNKRAGDFTPNDELVAEALGSLTGIAIKRQMLLDEAAEKQRLERDLDLARTIQRSQLPQQNPSLPGYDVAGWNQPADRTGGDCYDFFALDENRLAVMIADATGHGIGPALIMTQCRAILRALAGRDVDLTALMTRVNSLLCDDLPDDRFVTMLFGVLDCATHTLRYVSAGHGPLLLVHGDDGRVEQLEATCPLLGVMESMEMTAGEPLRLAPGDLFAVVTDGFAEWSGPAGEQYGYDRLIAVLQNEPGLPCAEMIRRLYDDVRTFGAGEPQADDLTAILIKRTSDDR